MADNPQPFSAAPQKLQIEYLLYDLDLIERGIGAFARCDGVGLKAAWTNA
jgi:hypothetical protein